MQKNEKQMFQKEDALPEWSLLFQQEKKQQNKKDNGVAIAAKYGQKCVIFSLLPSTLNGQYFQELKKKISSSFSLPRNSSVDLFFGGAKIHSESQFISAVRLSRSSKCPTVNLEVSLSEEESCILCLSSNCAHKTGQIKSNKRKNDEPVHLNILTPLAPPVSVKKRRICAQKVEVFSSLRSEVLSF